MSTSRVVDCRDGDGGRVQVLSPDVGWWSDHPQAGAWVGPGSVVGSLRTLGRDLDLILPEGVAGRAGLEASRRTSLAVEFGQVLFEISPLEGAAASAAERGVEMAGLAARSGSDLPVGSHAVVAPTDGFFYRCPSPGAAAFVEVGSRVRRGQPIGLVEVMKTFNQILYGGPGFPEEAEVVTIAADEGQEIRAGQVLMVVR
jgi:acetyl-CoA carboxylase biotin carboxyl carrier protein